MASIARGHPDGTGHLFALGVVAMGQGDSGIDGWETWYFTDCCFAARQGVVRLHLPRLAPAVASPYVLQGRWLPKPSLCVHDGRPSCSTFCQGSLSPWH